MHRRWFVALESPMRTRPLVSGNAGPPVCSRTDGLLGRYAAATAPEARIGREAYPVRRFDAGHTAMLRRAADAGGACGLLRERGGR